MEYNTVQKKLLIDFFKKNSNQNFTIDEITNKISVGKSTIYRLIPPLVAGGVIKKFNKNNENKSYYQYINENGMCNCHLHMKCIECGKIVHMQNRSTEHILSEIMKQEHFSVNKEQTVLFGECHDCSANKKEHNDEK